MYLSIEALATVRIYNMNSNNQISKGFIYIEFIRKYRCSLTYEILTYLVHIRMRMIIFIFLKQDWG